MFKSNIKLFIFFGVLFSFWIVLASKTDMQTIVVGIVVSSMLVFYNRNLISNKNSEIKFSLNFVFNFFVLLAKLLLEIIKANIHVALIVLNPKLPISPTVTTINTNIKSTNLKVFFSNSISLTPGTLTLVNDKDKIIVHCLTEKAKTDLEDWTIEKSILKLEES